MAHHPDRDDPALGIDTSSLPEQVESEVAERKQSGKEYIQTITYRADGIVVLQTHLWYTNKDDKKPVRAGHHIYYRSKIVFDVIDYDYPFQQDHLTETMNMPSNLGIQHAVSSVSPQEWRLFERATNHILLSFIRESGCVIRPLTEREFKAYLQARIDKMRALNPNLKN